MLLKLRMLAARFLGAAAAVLFSAVLWLLAIGLAGFACIVIGIAVMYGIGPGLIAAGVSLLCVATFIKRGLTNA